MRHLMTLAGIAMIGTLLAGCSGGNSGSEARAQLDFTDFVKKEVNHTRDNRDAVAVNDVDFYFTDQSNPNAFDDVLQ